MYMYCTVPEVVLVLLYEFHACHVRVHLVCTLGQHSELKLDFISHCRRPPPLFHLESHEKHHQKQNGIHSPVDLSMHTHHWLFFQKFCPIRILVVILSLLQPEFVAMSAQGVWWGTKSNNFISIYINL